MSWSRLLRVCNMIKLKGSWGGKRIPSPEKKLGRPHQPKRSKSMLKMQMTQIEPDENTMYLVGPRKVVGIAEFGDAEITRIADPGQTREEEEIPY